LGERLNGIQEVVSSILISSTNQKPKIKNNWQFMIERPFRRGWIPPIVCNGNTADGVGALVGNTTGNGNAGLGYKAGKNVITGNNNSEIGNNGLSTDTSVIRIGVQGLH
jgi:hypothetical protein